jgi:hypothetical protein
LSKTSKDNSMTKVRNDFKVYEEVTITGTTLWRIRSGGRRGDVATNCTSLEQANKVARELNLDPWYLSRGATRAERNA